MVVLGCERINCVLQGESSHADSIKTTSSGLGDDAEEDMAWRTA